VCWVGYTQVMVPSDTTWSRPKEFPPQDLWAGENSESCEDGEEEEEDGWDKIRYSDEGEGEEEDEWDSMRYSGGRGEGEDRSEERNRLGEEEEKK